MTDPRQEISDAALAEQLFEVARDDGVAIHPAVGVRIRQQIERAIEQKRSPWRAPRLLAPLVATALITGFFLARSEPEPAPESIVRAHRDPITLELAPGKRAELAPESALTFAEPPEVLEGEVEFRVAKLPEGETFRVRAAGVIVEVVGTIFTVRRIGRQVDVAVQEGAVRVIQGDAIELVRAGELWSTARQTPKSESVDTLHNPDLLGSRTERLLEESMQQAIHKAGSKKRPVVDEPKPSAEPNEEPIEASPAIKTPEQQRSLLELAAERMKEGDLDGARAIYRELTKGEASGAALALYLLARLEAGHAHRPEAALAALDELFARYPDQALAPEARASRIESLLDLARCAEAGRALEEFAERHADASDLIARSKVRHQTDCAQNNERSPGDVH